MKTSLKCIKQHIWQENKPLKTEGLYEFLNKARLEKVMWFWEDMRVR